jgi:hypothetical protein
MKTFIVALSQRMPEAKKAHKAAYTIKASSKFLAILKAYRLALVSHGRIDGVKPIIEKCIYNVQLGA